MPTREELYSSNGVRSINNNTGASEHNGRAGSNSASGKLEAREENMRVVVVTKTKTMTGTG